MRTIIFVLLFLSSFTSYSQILNIERYRLNGDSSKIFVAKATSGLSLYNRSAAADDPVNLFGYKWDVNTMFNPGKHAYILVSNFDYLRINDSDFLNFGLIHGRMVFNFEEKNNIETFVQYSFDNFRGLGPRWITGGTLRTRVIESDRITLILGLGALYENETWEHPFTEESINVQFIKSSNYFSFRLSVNEYVDFNMVNYYQVGYDQSIHSLRNRVNGNFNLNTKIAGSFSFTNSFEFSYEDKPIVPITSFIFAFRTGISYDF